MDKSIQAQRRRPLGIEEDVPDDSPTPDVRPDEEPEPPQQPGAQPVDTVVDVAPTSPRGEKWIAQQIEQGNRVIPNKFDDTSIIEIVFPERISQQVRNVVSQNRIVGGGQRRATVVNPSFRDENPEIAASLKSMQFLLTNPQDTRTSGYDIESILTQLRDQPVVVTKSPTVRTTIRFR